MDCKRYFSSGMFVFVCLGFFLCAGFCLFFSGGGFFCCLLGVFFVGFFGVVVLLLCFGFELVGWLVDWFCCCLLFSKIWDAGVFSDESPVLWNKAAVNDDKKCTK